MLNPILIKKISNFKPLVITGNRILGYSKGFLAVVDFDLNGFVRLCRFPFLNLLDKYLSRFRILDRILRLAPSSAIEFCGSIFIARRDEIWRYDCKSGTCVLDFLIPNGRRLLNFSIVEDKSGKPILVFGEYFANPHRNSVAIWGRNQLTSKWSILGEFKGGEIEHIHNIINLNGVIFVLTGDFGSAAGIWTFDYEEKLLKLLVRGEQKFRSVWIRCAGGRLYMATDTQLETNLLFEFKYKDDRIYLDKVCQLDGSSIYSCASGSELIFSTAVECGEPTGKFIQDVFDVTRGSGMVSNMAHVIVVRSDGKVKSILQAEKDYLPFRLGQFGTFTFPSGLMPAGRIYAYGQSLRGMDDACLLMIEREVGKE